MIIIIRIVVIKLLVQQFDKHDIDESHVFVTLYEFDFFVKLLNCFSNKKL